MEILKKNSALWMYLTDDLQALILDGESLMDHAKRHYGDGTSDFSYLVFPFAKAYEGFLKRLFLDLDYIREDEYYGDEIRIGRILNPGYLNTHGSVFERLCGHQGGGRDLATMLWAVWKSARNQVFHYFPHNFRRLGYEEALTLVQAVIEAMEAAVTSCDVGKRK